MQVLGTCPVVVRSRCQCHRHATHRQWTLVDAKTGEAASGPGPADPERWYAWCNGGDAHPKKRASASAQVLLTASIVNLGLGPSMRFKSRAGLAMATLAIKHVSDDLQRMCGRLPVKQDGPAQQRRRTQSTSQSKESKHSVSRAVCSVLSD